MRLLAFLIIVPTLLGSCKSRRSAETEPEVRNTISALTEDTESDGLPELYDEAPSSPARSSDYRGKAARAEAMMMREESYGSAEAASFSPGPRQAAGQLTAGEIHDFSKWALWEDLTEDELSQYRSVWQMTPQHRFAVQLLNQQDRPLVDARVQLLDEQEAVLWEARTDNLGQAELWAGLFDEIEISRLHLRVQYRGAHFTRQRLTAFQSDEARGVNLYRLPIDCAPPQAVEIAMVVDATGSMSDEIEYLQAELTDVIRRIQDSLPGQPIRLGSVFYRDQDDTYLTRSAPLSGDLGVIAGFLAEQRADGGGDYPEAVEAGLRSALQGLAWSDQAAARLLFLVLDAPPHQDDSVLTELHQLTQLAAEKGIRIIPVTASGIDKSTEYLMRSLALATNGTYTFLTNHSGIGGDHIEPSTDSYEVELLNDLLTRLVVQFARVEGCEPDPKVSQVPADTVRQQLPVDSTVLLASNDSSVTEPLPLPVDWRFFPNPTDGPLDIEVRAPALSLFLADANGKLLRRFGGGESKLTQWQLDLSDFPVGLYLLRVELADGRWLTGRVMRR